MTDELYPVRGDFRVLKLDGMFHVVFRSEAHPQWFRIIASFYTYDRAWTYCDVEISMWNDSGTADEEAGDLCPPPDLPRNHLGQAQPDYELAATVRMIYDEGQQVPALPFEPQDDQPEHEERPGDYYQRLREQAASDICKAADAPEPEAPAPEPEPDDTATDDELFGPQAAVLGVLKRAADPVNGLVSGVSLSRLAIDAGVPHGSISFLLESLERKRLMSVVERGGKGVTNVYRVDTRLQ